MKKLLKRCKLIDNINNAASLCDVLIDEGKIINIQHEILNIHNDEVQIIDCEGLYLAPGLIDMHCHLREPGYEYKEDIESGTKAAAAGGFSTVACMPNTKPVIDNPEAVKDIINRASKKAVINVLPIAAVTKGQNGTELTDFEGLKEAGACALSDDGRPVEHTGMMRQALINAVKAGLPIISHCEEMSIAEGAVNEGKISKRLELKGIPESAENIMISRECLLSLEYDVPVHIAHVSTKTGVELIKYFKDKGAKITCETCPHYFSLDETEILRSGTNAKMNPPLRRKEDVMAIKDAIKENVIDVIATDHAPHAQYEKELPLDKAPNGIVGFETALSVGISNLVMTGYITLERLIYKMTKAPANILGIDKGIIKTGSCADLVLFEPYAERKIDITKFHSKSKNSPYNGYLLNGDVKYTIVDGKIVYNNI